jgi:hypothetical protein
MAKRPMKMPGFANFVALQAPFLLQLTSRERSTRMAFDARLIAEVIWRCPVCGEEDSLGLRKKKRGIFSSEPTIVCSHCKSRWEEISANSMTLAEGDESLKGKRSIAEWATNLYTDELDLRPKNDVDTSILLLRDEGVIKKTDAWVFPVGRLGAVRSTGRRYGIFTNSFRLPPRNPLPKVEPLDSGEFVLTNKRIVFDGSRRMLNLELGKVVSVEVRNRFLELGYGDHKYAFKLGYESPFKWKTYIEAAFQALTEGSPEKAKPRRREARPAKRDSEKRAMKEAKKEEIREEAKEGPVEAQDAS